MKELQAVPKTLFIPLAARIYVSKKFPEYFYDEKSLALEKYIIEENKPKFYSEYTQMASAARYYNIDAMIIKFIKANKKCNIINIGAGLDTSYFRINNENARFYEVDLPEVMEIRREILGEYDNEILISSDMFNFEWAKNIDKTLPTLIISSGVFQYFYEAQVLEFIKMLKDNFSNSELIFDGTNEAGLKYVNKYVKKTGNNAAQMYFYINDSLEFAKKSNTTLIEHRGFFKDAIKMLSKKVGLYTLIAMKVADYSKRTFILHLKLNN